MSCYHPLKGFVLGVRPDGKKCIKIIKSDNLDYINKNEYADVIEIPCGKCIGCRLDYSREWANRCMLELKDHEHACFVTLTYNDEHLPEPNKICMDDGSYAISPIHPLNKSHLQKFWKRLRKAFPDTKIRYFACGEYGSSSFGTHRPHYHAIIYGVDFHEDRQAIKKDSEFTYYVSPTLEALWSDPKTKESYGFHLIADVNWNTCAYCARYCTKKICGSDNDFYNRYNIPSEFAVMSRKPGIGRNYFDEHKKEIYDTDEIFLTMRDGGKRINPPRYYDRCYDIQYPDDMERVRLSRSDRRETKNKIISGITDKSYLDYLGVLEDNKFEQIKALKRKEV